MAIVKTELGNNSCELMYDSATTKADLMTAIKNYITLHGWSLHDDDANGLGNGLKKAFKAPCFNSAMEKVVTIEVTDDILYLGVYEAWDEVNHTGLNMSYNCLNPLDNQRVNFTNGGYLYIFSNARWLGFYSRIGDEYGSENAGAMTFCIEVSRDFTEDNDVLGWPQWSWLNLGRIFQHNHYMTMRWPRYNNWVGQDAAMYTYVKSDLYLRDHEYSPLQAYPDIINPLTNKYDVANLIASMYKGAPRGRIFGLKLATKNSANWGDTMIAKCDSNYFLSQGGTDVQHHCYKQIIEIVDGDVVLIPK